MSPRLREGQKETLTCLKLGVDLSLLHFGRRPKSPTVLHKRGVHMARRNRQQLVNFGPTIYRFVESAKENGLNPYLYLTRLSE
mgnify:CR=1 FL=1